MEPKSLDSPGDSYAVSPHRRGRQPGHQEPDGVVQPSAFAHASEDWVAAIRCHHLRERRQPAHDRRPERGENHFLTTCTRHVGREDKAISPIGPRSCNALHHVFCVGRHDSHAVEHLLQHRRGDVSRPLRTYPKRARQFLQCHPRSSGAIQAQTLTRSAHISPLLL